MQRVIQVSRMRLAVSFAAILLFNAVRLCGQISTATLTGSVTDPTGAVVPGAVVEAKNKATQLVRTATTDSSNEYVIPDLAPAHYSLTFHSTGFKTFIVPNIELLVAHRAQINAKLEVGQVDQSMTVSAAAPIIDTASASVGQVVNTETVEHMPLNGRSFWQLTSLTPGATYNPGGQGTRTGGSSIRASVVSVNINGGAQTRQDGLSTERSSRRCSRGAPWFSPTSMLCRNSKWKARTWRLSTAIPQIW